MLRQALARQKHQYPLMRNKIVAGKTITVQSKAHLLPSVFILLSLLAAGAIPFAQAQRNAARPSGPAAKLPPLTGTGVFGPDAAPASQKPVPLPSAVIGIAVDETARIQALPAVAGGGCNPAWQAVANMPLDFYGGAAVSNGTFAYVAGGYSFSSGQSLSSLYRYDPTANTWTALTAFPAPGFIMASAVYYPITNKIYVFGGEEAVSQTIYNTTRIYDIASDTWTIGANMPDVRAFMGSGYNTGNGKIYLVSGYNTGQVMSAQPDTWEYDPLANTFTSKAPFPHPAGGMASGVINGHLYVAGGRDAAN